MWASDVEDIYPSWQAWKLEVEPIPHGGYHPFNPSILLTPQGDMLCSVRHANYLVREGVYHVKNGIVRTVNTMCHLDYNRALRGANPVITEWEVIQERDGLKRFPSSEHGYEDLRLFLHDEEVKAIATTAQLRTESRQEMVVLEFNEQWHITKAAPLRGPWGKYAQKNWVPYSSYPAGELKFLYNIDKWIEVRESDCKEVQDTSKQAPKRPMGHTMSMNITNVVQPRVSYDRWDNKGLRGGGQLCRVGDKYVGVGHDMDHARLKASGQKHYRHRFYDSNGNRGPWFTFGLDGIEFCSGMEVVQDTVFLSFGVGDSSAWVGTLYLGDVMPDLEKTNVAA